MNWKFAIQMAIPLIRGAGEAKRAEDPNNVGQDDLVGIDQEVGDHLIRVFAQMLNPLLELTALEARRGHEGLRHFDGLFARAHARELGRGGHRALEIQAHAAAQLDLARGR